MKFLLFIFFIALLVSPVYAQQDVVDSLEMQLKSSRLADTSRINLLNDLAFYSSSLDPGRGLEYSTRAVALAKASGQYRKLVTAFNYRALNYANMGRDREASFWYEQAIRQAKRLGNDFLEVGPLNNLAILYTNRSEYRKALALRLRALQIVRKKQDAKREGLLLNNIGVTYLYLSDFTGALSYYQKALKIAEAEQDASGKTAASINIGLVYKKIKMYPEALRYYRIALLNARGNSYSESDILSDMAAVYDETGDSRKAILLYIKALKLSQSTGNKRAEALHLTNLGIVYSNKRNYLLAGSYLKQAEKIYQTTTDYSTRGILSAEWAKIIISAPASLVSQFGIRPENRMNTALSYCKNALKTAQETGSVEQEMYAWELMSSINEKRGEYIKALSDYKHYTILKDSILNENRKNEIIKKEVQFAYNKKAAVTTLELQKQKAVKNSIIAGAVFLIIMAAGGFLFYKRSQDAKRRQQDLLYQARVSDIEMKVLRLQMNPHFIFNSLNSIADYIGKNDIIAADLYLSRFASLMRGILEYSAEREISLDEELRLTECYMQLEASRLPGGFTWSIELSGEIDPLNTFIPPLIFQPFIENSIWHGFANSGKQGVISISISRMRGLLKCVIEDNGRGIAAHGLSDKKGKSYGVKISRDRLAMLGKKKNEEADVRIRSSNEGTLVELFIPFECEIEEL